MRNRRDNSKKKAFEVGHELQDSVGIPRDVMDMLFGALFLTAFCVLVGGNLLVRGEYALLSSSLIAIPSFSVLTIVYMVSRYLKNIGWGLVLTYGLMCLVTYARMASLNVLFYAIALFAVIYTLRFISVKRESWLSLFLMAVAAAVTILFVTTKITSFDMMAWAQSGSLNQDTFFHASIAAMIKNYGVTSTGLNGLVSTPYYALSHILVAFVSALSGVSVIEVYGVAPLILFAPILIFGVVACCAALDESSNANVSIAWCATCATLAFFPSLFWRWAVWDSFFISESYLVSLGLFLAGIPLLFKKRLSVLDCLLVLCLAVFITHAKATVGLVYVGLWFTKSIVIQRLSSRTELGLSILVACAIFAVVLLDNGAVASVIGIMPFDFVYHYTKDGQCLTAACGTYSSTLRLWNPVVAKIAVVVIFVFMHFLLTWVFTGYDLASQGLRCVWRRPAVIYCLASFAAGMVVVAIFDMPGGAAYYVTNVAFFVALPFVACVIGHYSGAPRRSHWLVLLLVSMGIVWVKNDEQPGRFWLKPSNSSTSHLVADLLQARMNTMRNVALRPSEGLPTDNPVTLCWAQPFLYPAVSERPWVDIVSYKGRCDYKYYGYSNYGITDTEQSVTTPPRLMPGMKITSWPPQP